MDYKSNGKRLTKQQVRDNVSVLTKKVSALTFCMKSK